MVVVRLRGILHVRGTAAHSPAQKAGQNERIDGAIECHRIELWQLFLKLGHREGLALVLKHLQKRQAPRCRTRAGRAELLCAIVG